MKLVRHTTSDMARTDIFGNRERSEHWGQKHYFLIENATPAELMAMDELLEAAGWVNDGCPNYEEDDEFGNQGFSCGYHIDIDEVTEFKADYKRLKGEVAAKIEEMKAEAVDKALAAMTDEQVAIIARVTYNVRTDILTEGSTVNSLRNHDYSNPVANPFHNARNPLTADLWALVAGCLIIGKNETCASLRLLECKADAEIRRRRDAASQTDYMMTNRAFRAFWEASDFSVGVNALKEWEEIYTEALAFDVERDRRRALSADRTRLNELEEVRAEKRRIAEVVRAEFWMLNPARQCEELESAHKLARAINRLIGNADLLPEYSSQYGLTPADWDFVLEQTQRCFPDLWAADLRAAHNEALREDDRFQWLANRFAMFWGIGKDFQRDIIAGAHLEALIDNQAFNAACREEVMMAVKRYVRGADSAAPEPEDFLPIDENGELVIEAVAYIAIKPKFPLDFVLVDSQVFVGAVHTSRQYDTNYYLGAYEHTLREGKRVYMRVPGLSAQDILDNPDAFHVMPSEVRTLLPDVDHNPIGGVARLRDEILGVGRS